MARVSRSALLVLAPPNRGCPMSRGFRDMGTTTASTMGLYASGIPIFRLENLPTADAPVVVRDMGAPTASKKSSQVKGGPHHSIAGWCVSILTAHADRSATLLRNRKFALHYLQLAGYVT